MSVGLFANILNHVYSKKMCYLLLENSNHVNVK